MKILIFMAGFFPGKKYGGPPVSIDNFCNLMNGYETYIICSDHDLGETKRYDTIDSGWNDRGNCKVLYLTDSEYSISNLNKIAKEIDPDLIYLQSLFSKPTYVGLNVAKMNKIKVLLAPRGELITGAFKKKYKKIPYLYFLKIKKLLRGVYFQATSEDESYSIKKYLNVSSDNIFFLDNIPSISHSNYQREVKYPGIAKFVFISRIHPKKNLLKAIKYIKNIKGKIIFDIFGPIEDIDYWEKCEREIKSMSSDISINYRGIVNHNEVHSIFSKYDAFLFPTESENYGHVIAEALSVGIPIIISDKTPWSDVINFKAGWSISLDNDSQFIKAIQKVTDWDNSLLLEFSENAKKYFYFKSNIDNLKSHYIKVLNEISDNKDGNK